MSTYIFFFPVFKFLLFFATLTLLLVITCSRWSQFLHLPPHPLLVHISLGLPWHLLYNKILTFCSSFGPPLFSDPNTWSFFSSNSPWGRSFSYLKFSNLCWCVLPVFNPNHSLFIDEKNQSSSYNHPFFLSLFFPGSQLCKQMSDFFFFFLFPFFFCQFLESHPLTIRVIYRNDFSLFSLICRLTSPLFFPSNFFSPIFEDGGQTTAIPCSFVITLSFNALLLFFSIFFSFVSAVQYYSLRLFLGTRVFERIKVLLFYIRASFQCFLFLRFPPRSRRW